MAILKAIGGKNQASIARIIHYIMKDEKTETKLISGINCPGSLDCIQQMKMTKTMYNKEGGRQYKHYVLSFHPEDFQKNNAERAHEITMRLLGDTRIKPMLEGYEIAIATHIDREHVHSHIVVNSVNMETGEKYRQSIKDLNVMKEVVKDLEEEYHLHKAIEHSRKEKGDIVINNQKGYQAVKRNIEDTSNKKTNKYISWILEIFQKIMQVLKLKPKSKEEYVSCLEKEGIKVNWSNGNKHIIYEKEKNKKIKDITLSNQFDTDLRKETLQNEFESNRREYSESRESGLSKVVSRIVDEAKADARRQFEHRERIKSRIKEERDRMFEFEEDYRIEQEEDREL